MALTSLISSAKVLLNLKRRLIISSVGVNSRTKNIIMTVIHDKIDKLYTYSVMTE